MTVCKNTVAKVVKELYLPEIVGRVALAVGCSGESRWRHFWRVVVGSVEPLGSSSGSAHPFGYSAGTGMTFPAIRRVRQSVHGVPDLAGSEPRLLRICPDPPVGRRAKVRAIQSLFSELTKRAGPWKSAIC
jgi:hypothetical protein